MVSITADSFTRDWNTDHAQLDSDGSEFLSDSEINSAGLIGDQVNNLKDANGHITEKSVKSYLLAQGDQNASLEIINQINRNLSEHQGSGSGAKQAYAKRQIISGQTVTTNFNEEDFTFIDKDGNGEIDYHEWITSGNQTVPHSWGHSDGLNPDLFYGIGQEPFDAFCSARGYEGGMSRGCMGSGKNFSGTITKQEWMEWIAKQPSQAPSSGLTITEYQTALKASNEATAAVRDHTSILLRGGSSNKLKHPEAYTTFTQEDFKTLDTDGDGIVRQKEFITVLSGISEHVGDTDDLLELYRSISNVGTGKRQLITAEVWGKYLEKQNSQEARAAAIETLHSEDIASAKRCGKWFSQDEIDKMVENINARYEKYDVSKVGGSLPTAEQRAETVPMFKRMALEALFQNNCKDPEKYTSLTQEDFIFMRANAKAPDWIDPKYRETYETLRYKIFSESYAVLAGFSETGWVAQESAKAVAGGYEAAFAEILDNYKWLDKKSKDEWAAYLAKQSAAHS